MPGLGTYCLVLRPLASSINTSTRSSSRDRGPSLEIRVRPLPGSAPMPTSNPLSELSRGSVPLELSRGPSPHGWARVRPYYLVGWLTPRACAKWRCHRPHLGEFPLLTAPLIPIESTKELFLDRTSDCRCMI